MSSAHPVTQLPALIREAFDATQEPPAPERLAELDAALRVEVVRLQETARALAEQRPHRSRGWYALVNAADAADDALAFPSDTGFAGALGVAELARRVIELEKAVAS